ncbi:MAG: putative hydrolase or acyltransferase of alpha/beta superfamily [Acidimicrobiales bacterium]|nr:putative hydrolase or acyltransferase of alpha/beta superfamily [Acidimicrobiales bacterium]
MRAGMSTIEAGEGGRPLLLVHGFTGAKEDFADHVDALAAAGWHVVAPDLPGHGASHPEGAAFGFDPYAAAVLDLADELGWDRFALLGHSMGGVVAQHLAISAPERLTALILMDTSPDRVVVDAELVELACGVVSDEGMPALLAIQRALGGPLDTEPSRRLRAERPGWDELQDQKLLNCSGEMYVTMARLLTSTPSRAAELATLTVPTLVLVGEDDQLLREPSRRLADAIPGARFVVIPGAGHSPQVEAPAAWFQTITEFLASPRMIKP